MAIRIHSLTLYPVKSCAPVSVRELRCNLAGPSFDREWMIVGPDDKFVTQRELPKLALIQPRLSDRSLELSAANRRDGVEVALERPGPSRPVEIWGQRVSGHDEGDNAADWISEFAGQPLRLVRISGELRRREGEDPRTVRFVDSYPLHLTSLTSLADLNQRLPSPIGIERFRANIVVEGAAPWAEDGWRSVKIDGKEFRIGKRCERCTITTVDPATGTRGSEPLKTLSGFRRNAKNKIEFGQYLHSVEGATLALGMELEPS